MEQTLSSLENQKNWKEAIKKWCRKNKINVQIAAFFTPIKIRAFYDRLLNIYETRVDSDEMRWIENELKAFHWLLAVISSLKERLIQNFDKQEWKILGEIFKDKDLSIIKYESIKLVNQKINKNRNWNFQQTQLLTRIMRQNYSSNKWNDIARKLYQYSQNLFFRSGKQCRQRWLNHLDPNKKRGQWTQEEDRTIIKYIANHGKRWSKIAKELGNHRTQHMVKNRFKTLLIHQRKISPKTSKQSTLLLQIGVRLFGKSEVAIQKELQIKRENQSQMNEQSNFNIYSDNQAQLSQKQKRKSLKRNNILIAGPSHDNMDKNQDYKELKKRKSSQNLEDSKGMKKQVLSQNYEKGFGAVTTPMSAYQMQQIYSPYYLSYQGITPYISPTSAVPFFVNTPMSAQLTPSFSTFDNALNQNLFICPNMSYSQGFNSNFPQ